MSYKDDLYIKISQSNSCELVALQYQAIIDNILYLSEDIKENNSLKTFEISDKIRDIISNLIASLGTQKTDFKEKTIEIYLYVNKKINEAIITKDTTDLKNIIKLMESLKDAWYSAGGDMRKNDNNVLTNSTVYGKTGINMNNMTNDFGRG